MRRFSVTDEQIIARVYKSIRSRRMIGTIFLILGIAGFAAFLYWTNDLLAKAISMLIDLNHGPPPGRQQIDDLIKMSANMGFTLGFFFAGGMGGCGSLAIHGLVMILFKNRKDHMLLKYWENQIGASNNDQE